MSRVVYPTRNSFQICPKPPWERRAPGAARARTVAFASSGAGALATPAIVVEDDSEEQEIAALSQNHNKAAGYFNEAFAQIQCLFFVC
jgi:hypothetical protein